MTKLKNIKSFVLFICMFLLFVSFVFASVSDTLNEGEQNTYTLSGNSYVVKLHFVDSDDVKFSVNGLYTRNLDIGHTDTLFAGSPNKIVFKVTDIEYEDVAGGIHRSSFSIIFEGTEEPVIEDPVTCSDSDNGENFYTKGRISTNDPSWDSTVEDKCASVVSGETQYVNSCGNSNCYIVEHYCTGIKPELIMSSCINGCNNGACLKNQVKSECTDSDGGKDYNSKGTTKVTTGSGQQTLNDNCWSDKTNSICEGKNDGCTLTEYSCDDDKLSLEIYDCPNGCSKGACIKSETSHRSSNRVVSTTVTVPSSSGSNDNVESTSNVGGIIESKVACSVDQDCVDQNPCTDDYCKGTPKSCFNEIGDGCVFNKNCVPYGLRLGLEYCNINKSIMDQKPKEAVCRYDYECLSDVCINYKCFKSNLFQKIIIWFRKIF